MQQARALRRAPATVSAGREYSAQCRDEKLHVIEESRSARVTRILHQRIIFGISELSGLISHCLSPISNHWNVPGAAAPMSRLGRRILNRFARKQGLLCNAALLPPHGWWHRTCCGLSTGSRRTTVSHRVADICRTGGFGATAARGKAPVWFNPSADGVAIKKPS